MAPWRPGDIITRREVLHGETWLEHPVTVVADDGDVLAVRLDPGSVFTFFPDHPFGPHPWRAHETWGGSVVLMLVRAGSPYAVWKFFAPTPPSATGTSTSSRPRCGTPTATTPATTDSTW